MLFYSKINLNGDKLIALLYKGSKDGETYYRNTSDMIFTENLCQTMTLNGNLVTVDSVGDHPIVLAKPISSNMDITPIYNIMLPKVNAQISDGAFENLAKQWNAQMDAKVEPEDFKQLFLAMGDLQAYMKSPVTKRVEVPSDLIDNAPTRELINNLNMQQVRLSYIRNKDNMTRRMQSPKDKVMIKLPTYEDCVSYVNGIGSLVDISKTDVMPDYPKFEYKTPMFRNYLDRGYDVKNIIGSFENNKPGVYENEQELYNRLVELINLGIEQDFPDRTLEECIEEGISSPNVRTYLIDLACNLSRFGWNHCPNMPLPKQDENGDDDDDSEGSEYIAQFQSDGTILSDQRAGIKHAVTSDASLENFIENVSKKNIYAVAEIIVKLLRWGERKPSELVVDKSHRALDLNTFTAKNIVPSIDECELVRNGNAEFTLLQAIDFSGSFKDTRYLENIGVNANYLLSISLPIGGVLVSKYKQPNSPALIERRIYASAIDIIEILNKNPENINGITKDASGDYKVSSEVLSRGSIGISDIIAKLNRDTNGYDVVYTTDDIKELCIKLNQKCNGLSYLKIMFDYMISPNTRTDLGTLYCVSREDFIDKAQGSMYAGQVIRATIGANSMPQIVKALADLSKRMDEEGEAITLEDTLNGLDLALMKEPIDLSLEDDEEDKSLEQIKMDKTADKLSRMLVGGSGEDKPKEELKTENKVEKQEIKGENRGEVKMGYPDFFIQPTANDIYRPIILSPQQPKLIGYLVQVKDGDNEYRLLVRDKVGDKVAKQEITLDKFVKIMCNEYFYLLTGKPDKCKLRFQDDKTAVYFIKHIREGKVSF